MRIAVITDAWTPQVNGVVTTLQQTQRILTAWGHEVLVLSPQGHVSIPCPTYSEIRLALFPARRLTEALVDFDPDSIHIATEGPLGSAARRFCGGRGLAFTTSYHTRFPQYLSKRLPIPESWSFAYLRRYHNGSCRTLAATEYQRRELVRHGFENVVIWPRGVDTRVFRPCGRDHLQQKRPIWIYAGRVAVEKNLEAFLDLELPGSKLVVGDGPSRSSLQERYPEVSFAGYRFGADLARLLSSADVFVFPSRTDTFGLVMLESIACGTPVAAYPVMGPLDVVDGGVTGVLSRDLRAAAMAALRLDRESVSAGASRHTWEQATREFLSHLVYVTDGRSLTPPDSRLAHEGAAAPKVS